MFEMYASGNHSMSSVAHWATKEANLRSKLGNILSKSNIEKMFHNTYYYGVAHSKKYKTYTPHKYPKIITEELFQRCQVACEEKRAKPAKTLSREFAFKGVCTCDNCGCLYTPELHTKKSGKSFVYYSCTNGKHICKREYVPESVFLEPIGEILAKLQNITPEVQEYLLKELKKRIEKDRSFEERQIQSLRAERKDKEAQIDNLIDALSSLSSITRDKCDKKIQSLNDEISLIEQKLAKYS